MDIQSYVKEYISKNGGLDYFTDQLELLKPLVPSELQYKVDGIKLYMYIIHEIDVDIENDFIVRKESFKISTDMFNALYKQNGSLFAKLMLGMYKYGFSKTKNIRKIS